MHNGKRKQVSAESKNIDLKQYKCVYLRVGLIPDLGAFLCGVCMFRISRRCSTGPNPTSPQSCTHKQNSQWMDYSHT